MNRGYLQTYYKLYRDINISGCFFRTLGAMVEDLTEKQLHWKQINKVYDIVVSNGGMDVDCTVNDPSSILYAFGEILGVSVRGYDVATQYPDKHPEYYGWVKKSGDLSYDYIIKKVWTSGGHYHFMLYTRDGILLFDPYPIEVSVKEIYDIFYRLEVK